MIEIISEKTPIAKKDYECMACLLVNEHINNGGFFTFSDYRKIVKAKKNNWKIRKGDRYIYQFNTDGSNVCEFRAMPIIHKLCIKYDLYEEF